MVVEFAIQTEWGGHAVVSKALLAFERGQRSEAHFSHNLKIHKM